MTGEQASKREWIAYEAVKERLAFRLIPQRGNERLLEIAAHIRFLDLAILFYFTLEAEDRRYAMITIGREQMEAWNMEPEELFQTARRNCRRNMPPEFGLLWEQIAKMTGSRAVPEAISPIYILSNADLFYGAACILYEGVLREIALQLGSDLLILPSSVHEVLIVPDESEWEKSELEWMVRGINREVVAEEDRLSDQIYRYSLKTGQLEGIDGQPGVPLDKGQQRSDEIA
ncbi:DUF5688 family protein [Lachnoclostridium sp. An14]|uniref:DUF5688 family protein n=1 Tax=Lachnoclostridium sp. An14 TaxID=1965562 RepID=UPI00117A2743|nr:DUF5688 family protein [Lachnoclostridium sp. An14]